MKADVLVLFAVVMASYVVSGETLTFKGKSGDSWAAATSWNPEQEPAEGDDVIVNTATIRVEASDQEVINRLNSITVKQKEFYVRSNNTVTFPCSVSLEHGTLGYKTGGTMQFGGKMTATVSTIEAAGDIRFVTGATLDMSSSKLFRAQQDATSKIHFACQFPSDANLPIFQSRPNGTFVFDVDDAFANCDPLFVFGTASAPAGILDLNGHDQKISRMTFPPVAGGTAADDYCKSFSFKSETAATLTITKGTLATSSPVSGSTGVFHGQLDGGISVKLDADGTGTSTFEIENVTTGAGVQLYSSTTGSLISAAGTFKVRDGSRLPNLTSLVLEGAGNFEIGNAVFPQAMDVYLGGTGTMKLANDLSVTRAFASDGQGGWVRLGKGEYDNSKNSRIDAASTGKLIVLTDDEVVEGYTYTWTGAAQTASFTDAANWACAGHPEVTPDFTSGSEVFVFPASVSSVVVSGNVKAYGVTVAATDGFTFADGGEGCLQLGPKGLDASAAAGTVRLDCGVAIDTAKDVVWNLGTDVTLFVGGALASDENLTDQALTVQGVRSGSSRVTIAADNSAFYRRLAFDECAYVLSSNVWAFGKTEAVFHSTVAILPPRIESVRACQTPLTMDFPFDQNTTMDTIYQSGDGSKFTFGGRLTLRGQLTRVNPNDSTLIESTGYAMLKFSTDVDIFGGVRAEGLNRVQFDVPRTKNGLTVAFRDGVISRGYLDNKDKSLVDFRLYGSWSKDKYELDAQFDGDDKFYVALATLVCKQQDVLTATFRPAVNSYTPDKGAGDRWSVIDLNGTTQTIGRLYQEISGNMKSPYTDGFVEFTSEQPGTLAVTKKDGNSYNNGLLKFTGQSSLLLGGEWKGIILITNHVSTTVGSLTVTNGTLQFAAGAGWAGKKSQVTIGGSGTNAGKIQMKGGACGFASTVGGASKVKLALQDEGKLDLDGQELSVLNCCVDGTYLGIGTYEVGDTRLGGHVTGSGRITVRSADPDGRLGLSLILR